MTPPRRLRIVGSNQFLRNDYNVIGRELMRYLVDIGGLQVQDNVLDVGCGVGRIAARLAHYLDSCGSYDGFDIVKEAVDWCNENIGAVNPGFQFVHADIFNAEYNPSGMLRASEYKFPYVKRDSPTWSLRRLPPMYSRPIWRTMFQRYPRF